MSLPLNIREEARAEFREAVDWHEQRWPGQGAELIAAVELVFDRILANPRRGRVMDDPIRRVLVPDFPYAVFYYPREDAIVVTCVFHTSRDPAVWQGRR